MRYRETGNVHPAFYARLNVTIAFLRRQYGLEFLDETFRRAARDVYRSIRENLSRGDPAQLVEHWTYFLDREHGEYEIERSGDEIRITVHRCPAIAYLQREGIKPDAAFCRQTIVMNNALADGSPFEIATEVVDEGRCVQTIRRVRS